MEAAAGALELFGATLPEGMTGPQVGGERRVTELGACTAMQQCTAAVHGCLLHRLPSFAQFPENCSPSPRLMPPNALCCAAPAAQLIRSIMDKAVEHGLTVMRTWAHTVTPHYALQTGPGEYNEAVGAVYALCAVTV